MSLDMVAVERTITSLSGVDKAAVHTQSDGAPEAMVAVSPSSDLDPSALVSALADLVPGYTISTPMHVFREVLAHKQARSVD